MHNMMSKYPSIRQLVAPYLATSSNRPTIAASHQPPPSSPFLFPFSFLLVSFLPLAFVCAGGKRKQTAFLSSKARQSSDDDPAHNTTHNQPTANNYSHTHTRHAALLPCPFIPFLFFSFLLLLLLSFLSFPFLSSCLVWVRSSIRRRRAQRENSTCS